MERLTAAIVGVGLGLGLIWTALLPEERIKELTNPDFLPRFLIDAWNAFPAMFLRIGLILFGVFFLCGTYAALG